MLGNSRARIPLLANLTLTVLAQLPYPVPARMLDQRHQGSNGFGKLWLRCTGRLTENVKMDCGAVAALAVHPERCSNKSRFRLMKRASLSRNLIC